MGTGKRDTGGFGVRVTIGSAVFALPRTDLPREVGRATAEEPAVALLEVVVAASVALARGIVVVPQLGQSRFGSLVFLGCRMLVGRRLSYTQTA
jgi:hypothetical protein